MVAIFSAVPHALDFSSSILQLPSQTSSLGPATPSPSAPSTAVFGLNDAQIQFLAMIGSVGALILSVVLAGLSLMRAQRDARNRHTAERLDARLRQARQVHWWIEPCPDHPRPLDLETFLVDVPEYESCWGQSVVIANRSDEPIHDVVLDLPDRRVADKLRTWAGAFALGPNSSRRVHFTGYGESLLDPQFNRRRQIVFFADSDGVQWTRDSAGVLAERTYDVSDVEAASDEHQVIVDRALREVARLRGKEPNLLARDTENYLQLLREKVSEFRQNDSAVAHVAADSLLRRARARVRTLSPAAMGQVPPALLDVDAW